MADIAGAISSMVALLIITALGFLAAKLGYLNKGNRQNFSNLLFNITLPCTILASVGSMDADSGGELIATAFALAIAKFIIMSAFSALCNVVLRVPKAERHIYLFMGLFVNVGFIGISVVESIYGGGAAFLGSIFMSIFNLCFYGIGINFTLLVSADGAKPKFDPKNLISAPFIASIAAIALFFSGFQLPDFLDQAISLTGAATAPLAMMLVGLNMALADMKSVFTEKRLYAFTVLRFLVLPAVAFLIARIFVADPLALGVFTMMLAMPVGTLAPALCSTYNQDTLLATKGVIITTLASFIIIPILIAFTALV